MAIDAKVLRTKLSQKSAELRLLKKKFKVRDNIIARMKQTITRQRYKIDNIRRTAKKNLNKVVVVKKIKKEYKRPAPPPTVVQLEQKHQKDLRKVKDMYIERLAFFLYSFRTGNMNQAKIINTFFVINEYCVRNNYHQRYIALVLWAHQFEYFTMEHADSIPDLALDKETLKNLIEGCRRNGLLEKVGQKHRYGVYALSEKAKEVVSDIHRLVATSRAKKNIKGKFLLDIKKDVAEAMKLARPAFKKRKPRDWSIKIDYMEEK